MKSEIIATLASDSTLSVLLTGGIHPNSSDDTYALEISRQATPSAFDEFRELLPCALVTLASDTPEGASPKDGARVDISIYLYRAPEEARFRIYQLLHQVRVAPNKGTATPILHIGDLINQHDAVLDAPLTLCRYVVWVRKTGVTNTL